jgi:hypothetical protein
MNAGSGNLRYWQPLWAGWSRPYGKASRAIISATAGTYFCTLRADSVAVFRY